MSSARHQVAHSDIQQVVFLGVRDCIEIQCERKYAFSIIALHYLVVEIRRWQVTLGDSISQFGVHVSMCGVSRYSSNKTA